jgi:hypothetical protein
VAAALERLKVETSEAPDAEEGGEEAPAAAESAEE